MLKTVLLIIMMTVSVAVHSKEPTKEITLTKDNSVAFFGVVNPITIGGAIGDIKKLDANLKSGYPIYLVLNTPGGQITAGMNFISFLNSLNRPVHTITLFAASMGFQMVQNLGERYITEYGVLMSHKASGGFSGEFGGEASQLDSRYSLWLRKINRLDKQTVLRTNGKQTLKSYRAAYENELWLNGWEAVKQGYADRLSNIKCDATLKGLRKLHLTFRGRKLTAIFNACPILTELLEVKLSIDTNRGVMDSGEFIASGGKFGKKRRVDDVKQYSYANGTITLKKELCAYDHSLSIGKINEIIKSFRIGFENVRGQVNKNKMKI